MRMRSVPACSIALLTPVSCPVRFDSVMRKVPTVKESRTNRAPIFSRMECFQHDNQDHAVDRIAAMIAANSSLKKNPAYPRLTKAFDQSKHYQSNTRNITCFLGKDY